MFLFLIYGKFVRLNRDCVTDQFQRRIGQRKRYLAGETARCTRWLKISAGIHCCVQWRHHRHCCIAKEFQVQSRDNHDVSVVSFLITRNILPDSIDQLFWLGFTNKSEAISAHDVYFGQQVCANKKMQFMCSYLFKVTVQMKNNEFRDRKF